MVMCLNFLKLVMSVKINNLFNISHVNDLIYSKNVLSCHFL